MNAINRFAAVAALFAVGIVGAVQAQATESDLDALRGLKISVLGDSWSTLKNVTKNQTINNESTSYYYPSTSEGSDVTQEGHLWWKMVANTLGLSVDTVDAWGGSAVSMVSSAGADKFGSSFLNRVNGLGNPDIIVIMPVGNDAWIHITEREETVAEMLGDYVYDSTGWTFDATSAATQKASSLYHYRPAVAALISRVRVAYPKARVYYAVSWNSSSEASNALKESAETICAYYDVPFIPMVSGTIEKDGGSHPTIAGQRTVADYLTAAISNDFANVASSTKTGNTPTSGAWSPNYTALEYVESTGTQVALTDYCPNSKTCMEAELSLAGSFKTSRTSQQTTCLFGCSGDSKNYYCNFSGTAGQDKIILVWMGSGDNKNITVTQAKDIKTKMLTEQNLFTWDNAAGKNTVAPSGKSGTLPNPLAIMGYNNGTLVKQFAAYEKMRVYSWKIYESDDGTLAGANKTLVHDFWPAIENATGHIGFYDRVTRGFISSYTTTPFVAGPPTKRLSCTALEYIEATGTQVALTDYYPNSKTCMEAELYLSGSFKTGLQSPQTTCLFGCSGDSKNYYCNFSGTPSEDKVINIWMGSGNNTSMTVTQAKGIKTKMLTEQNQITWDNATGKDTASTPRKAGDLTTPLAIMGYNNGTLVKQFAAYEKMRVYSWKIYESDNGTLAGANKTLVHDFRPAVEDVTGRVGFYDRVTRDFILCYTDTPFVAGPRTTRRFNPNGGLLIMLK